MQDPLLVDSEHVTLLFKVCVAAQVIYSSIVCGRVAKIVLSFQCVPAWFLVCVCVVPLVG